MKIDGGGGGGGERGAVDPEKHLNNFQELLPKKYYNVCLVDYFHWKSINFARNASVCRSCV